MTPPETPPQPESTYRLLLGAAGAWPDGIATQWIPDPADHTRGLDWTCAELARTVTRIANALTARGVRRQDAVTLSSVDTSMLYAAAHTHANQLACAPGQAGVLVIGSPAVFAGYVTDPRLGGPRVSRDGAVRDGWLDTGDLGGVDAAGFVSLAGRAKDLIIRGGHNIDPEVIEDALLSRDAVAGFALTVRTGPSPIPQTAAN